MKEHFLLYVKGEVGERPQHAFMRTALSIHREDITRVIECYELMSTHRIAHPPETFFGSGALTPWLSTYTTRGLTTDNLGDAFDAVKDCTTGLNHAGEASITLQYLSATRYSIDATIY